MIAKREIDFSLAKDLHKMKRTGVDPTFLMTGAISLEVPRRRATLVGFGLDNNDGEVRVTRSENFHLLGGSKETHEVMQDKCIRFNERLQARGKQMAELAREEFLDIAAECEINIAMPPKDQS